jgi:hypothetical protein
MVPIYPTFIFSILVVYTLDPIRPASRSLHIVSYVTSAFVLGVTPRISNVIDGASIIKCIKRCDALHSADRSLVGHISQLI